MTLGFVIFGIKDNSGSTTNAIHVARYFASGGLSTALVEPASIKSPCLRDYTEGNDIPYIKDDVLIYPLWEGETPDSEIVVYDMGTIGPSQVLKFNRENETQNYKYFLCYDPAAEDEYDLQDFLSRIPDEIKPKLTILLKECGEQKLQLIKKLHFKSYKIGYSKTICPDVLSDILTGICNFNGIIPPSINYDLDDWFSSINTRIEKKSFFGFRRKKKEIPNSDEAPTEDAVAIPDLSVDTFMFDEDGLPIPAEEEFKGLTIHERDPDLKSKPDLKYDSSEDYERSFELKRKEAEAVNASGSEIISNTIDGIKDAGGIAVNGIFDILKKIKKKKPEDDDETNQKAPDVKVDTGNIVDTEQTHETHEEEKSDSTLDTTETGAPKEKPNSGTAKKLFSFMNKIQDGLRQRAKEELDDSGSAFDIDAYTDVQLPTEAPKPAEKEKKSKLKFAGHLTVFVTALKHGAGCSHVAASIGASLAGSNNTVCFVHDKKTESPEGKYLSAYTDRDYGQAYSLGRTVIFDLGCLGELTREAMERIQMADVRVLVCGSSENDISALARFIRKSEESAKEWLYVFNLTSGKRKRDRIDELMQEYDHIFLKSHDYEELPKDVIETWSKQIRKKIK